MAYVQDEDEEEQAAGQPQQGAEKVITPGGGGDVDAGNGQGTGAGTGAAAASPRGTSSGAGWTNLSKYVDANQGADTRMGSAVKGVHDKTQTAAQGNVNTYGQTATGAIKSGTVTDTGVISQLGNIGNPQAPAQPKPAKVAGAPPAGRPMAPGHVQAPTLVSSQAFANNLSGYKGPNEAQGIEGFGGAETDVQKTLTSAGQAQDFEGRRTFLDNAYGSPKYSAGEQRLDSFLVGAGQGGREQLDQIDQGAKGLKTGWEDLVNRVGTDIDAGRTTSGETKRLTEEAFRGAQGRMETQFAGAQGKADAANTTNSAAYQKTLAGLKSNAPGVAYNTFKGLGVDPAVGLALLKKGVPAEKIVAAAKAQSLGDFTSAEDQAQWSHLGELGSAGGLSGGKALDFTKSGSSGKSHDTNQEIVTKGKQMLDLETSLTNKMNQGQSARETGAADLAARLGSSDSFTFKKALAELGIGADLGRDGPQGGLDDRDFTQAKKMGLDLTKFMGGGKKLNMGDVATDDDRKGWADLMTFLGASSNVNLADTQDEGNGSGFDVEAFKKALGEVTWKGSAPMAQTSPGDGKLNGTGTGSVPTGHAEKPYWQQQADKPQGVANQAAHTVTGQATKAADSGKKLTKKLKRP